MLCAAPPPEHDQLGSRQRGTTHLRAHMLRYFRLNSTLVAGVRIGDLTLSMLGSDSRSNAQEPHPGSSMPTKAAETRVLMSWALAVLRTLGHAAPHRDALIAAGVAMERCLELIHTTLAVVPAAAQNEMWACAQRHILLTRARLVPEAANGDITSTAAGAAFCWK